MVPAGVLVPLIPIRGFVKIGYIYRRYSIRSLCVDILILEMAIEVSIDKTVYTSYTSS